jgi:TRAP-type uncharacterized transport system substrate-binding protein
MSMRGKLVKVLWKWVAPLAGLTALACAFFFYFYSPRQKSYHLSLTAGNKVGMRHELAERLRSELVPRRITLDLRPSAGSEQALDWVNTRQVDAALVQGGLVAGGRPDVRQVATLHVEPMHLLVKQELLQDASKSLKALRGKRVDLGEKGSGTHSLASAIMGFVGLQPGVDYQDLHLSQQELRKEVDASNLPDAVFQVSTLPSPTAKYLVTKHGYRLVPLPFAEAFALETLTRREADRQSAAENGGVEMGRIHATTIPAFVYSADPPVPAEPLPTLGTRLLLVAHKDVPAKAAYRLVEATYAVEFGQIVRPALDAKLMDLPPEFPWHEGAVLYQQRNAPLLPGAVMDSAQKGFAILAAAASGLFVLWQWVKQSGQFARTKGFNKYISQVARIEERALEAERGKPLAVPELAGLRDQLCQLKTQALDEFADGELGGKELLGGFLVQVNDVRDYLMRLYRQQKGGRGCAGV